MKTLLTTILLALMFVPAGFHAATAAGGPSTDRTAVVRHGGEAELSLMTLKVKKIVGKDAKAEALKNDLTALKGVKEVDACTKSGTVKISYSKAELGCCSVIHAALKDSKWKYELVSNEERPACSHSKGAGKKGSACPHSQKKEKGA